jgi:PKD repeat protein
MNKWKTILAAVVGMALLLAGLTGLVGCSEQAKEVSASFSAWPTSGTAPLEVDFYDYSTGDIEEWAWDFDNDGAVDSTEQDPSYTYDTVGLYTVSLTATGPGGSGTKTITDYIDVGEEVVAGFSASLTSGTAPLEVTFTDNSTGDIEEWDWDFDNDGVVDSTEQSPSYTYDAVGLYTVSLTVTGPYGSDTETITDCVEVVE